MKKSMQNVWSETTAMKALAILLVLAVGCTGLTLVRAQTLVSGDESQTIFEPEQGLSPTWTIDGLGQDDSGVDVVGGLARNASESSIVVDTAVRSSLRFMSTDAVGYNASLVLGVAGRGDVDASTLLSTLVVEIGGSADGPDGSVPLEAAVAVDMLSDAGYVFVGPDDASLIITLPLQSLDSIFGNASFSEISVVDASALDGDGYVYEIDEMYLSAGSVDDVVSGVDARVFPPRGGFGGFGSPTTTTSAFAFLCRFYPFLRLCRTALPPPPMFVSAPPSPPAPLSPVAPPSPLAPPGPEAPPSPEDEEDDDVITSSNIESLPPQKTYDDYEQSRGAYGEDNTSVRAGRGGRADLFYPTTNGRFADGPFPVIGYGHGAGASTRSYFRTARLLARHGYIVILPRAINLTSNSILLDCVRYVKGQNANPSSILFGKVDVDNIGLTGHSMGGGAAANGAAAGRDIVKAFMPLHPNPFSRLRDATQPAFVTGGSRDFITSTRLIKSAGYVRGRMPKIFAELRGAGHLEPYIASNRWDPYVLAFFDLYLRGDLAAANLIWGTGVLNDRRMTRPVEVDPQIVLTASATVPIVSPAADAGVRLLVQNDQGIPSSFDIRVDGPGSERFAINSPDADAIPPLRRGGSAQASLSIGLGGSSPAGNARQGFRFTAIASSDGGTCAFADASVRVVDV